MGGASSCSPCCRSKIDKSTQALPRSPLKELLPSSPLKPPETKVVKSVGAFKIGQKHEIDISSLDQIAENADFSNEVDESISLDIDIGTLLTEEMSISSKRHQKRSQKEDWKGKFFTHGMLSDVVTDVESETHGCVSSAVSENITGALSMLHQINIQADTILKDRISKITDKEQQFVNQFTGAQDVLFGRIIENGRSYANNYEGQYRKLVEDFIQRLESELADCLDDLQKSIKDDKDTVFMHSCNKINIVTQKADKARAQFHRRLQSSVEMKRREIMLIIQDLLHDTTTHPLGYEQLRTLKLQIYSTVGNKGEGQGCDVIPDRQKYIDDIDRVKPPHPRIKKTTYIETSEDQQQKKRISNRP